MLGALYNYVWRDQDELRLSTGPEERVTTVRLSQRFAILFGLAILNILGWGWVILSPHFVTLYACASFMLVVALLVTVSDLRRIAWWRTIGRSFTEGKS